MSYVSNFNVINKNVKIREKTGIHNIEGFCYGYYTDAKENQQTQSLFVFKLDNGKTIMFDTGYFDESENIKAWFRKINVTKIDYLAISHYHLDHAGGLRSLSTFLDFTNCTLFIPETVKKDSRVAQSIYDLEKEVKTIAVEKNMTVIQPSVEGEKYDIDDGISLIFHNVHHDHYYLLKDYNYNNCSLTPILTNGDNKFFHSADINVEAQMFLSDVLPVCKISTICHHGYNRNCYRPYFDNLSYEYAIAPNGRGRNSTDPDKTLNTVKTMSGEAYLAEERGIPIYATSDTEDNNLYFVITPDTLISKSKEIERTKIIREYNSLNEVLNFKGSIVDNARAVLLPELLDKMNNNSHLLCNVKPSYNLCPERFTSGCILEVNKSDSSFDSTVFDDTTRATITYYEQVGTKQSQTYSLFGVKHGDGNWVLSLSDVSKVEAYRFGDVTTDSGRLTLKDYLGDTIVNSTFTYGCIAIVTAYFSGDGVFDLVLNRDLKDYTILTMDATSSHKSQVLLFGFKTDDVIRLVKRSGTTITYNIGIVPLSNRWDIDIRDFLHQPK